MTSKAHRPIQKKKTDLMQETILNLFYQNVVTLREIKQQKQTLNKESMHNIIIELSQSIHIYEIFTYSKNKA